MGQTLPVAVTTASGDMADDEMESQMAIAGSTGAELKATNVASEFGVIEDAPLGQKKPAAHVPAGAVSALALQNCPGEHETQSESAP